jgi:hypothetical protein
MSSIFRHRHAFILQQAQITPGGERLHQVFVASHLGDFVEIYQGLDGFALEIMVRKLAAVW